MFSKKKGASWTYDTPSFIFLVLMHKKKHLHNEDAIQFNQLSWDTRTRTRNDRTRICSVTITPYPNVQVND